MLCLFLFGCVVGFVSGAVVGLVCFDVWVLSYTVCLTVFGWLVVG